MSRVVIISLSSLLLVGAVTLGLVRNWGKSNDVNKLAASTKAVQAICQPTDYKEACFKSMSSVKSDDPKELVKAAFDSAKAEIRHVAEKSAVLKELEKDPNTAEAVKDCKELFQDAIDDLQRSFQEVGDFEWDNFGNMLGNIKVWLSATITYQETCLDGFDNTTGDATHKVRKLLQTASHMSSNGLAILNDFSSLLGTPDLASFNPRRLLQANVQHHRRLLSSANEPTSGEGDGDTTLLEDDEVDRRRRRLLGLHDDAMINGHDDDMMPIWLQGSRRKLLEATNLSEDLKAKANVVVSQDGSGKYKTIEEALKEIPKNSNDSFIIYIKEGVYNEYLVLYKWMTHVVFVGDGPTKTRITNNKNFADGTKTFKTATLSVLGDFFMAKDIGIENSAGAIKHQAVALRVQSDQSIFYNCHMDGYQDTLYAHTYRQFYRDCRVTGTIDFIFGDAAAFFQNCTFVVRKPLDNQHCIVTAQGRMERHQPTGIIIHRSRFESDPEYHPVRNKNKAFLGRPWKEYSKTIIMESYIDDLIQPDGWLPWEGNFGLDTCYYGEYNNNGPGSSLANRVKWRGIKIISTNRADKFTPPQFFENDEWIKASGIPYDPSLFAPPPSLAALGEDEDPNAPAGAPSNNIEFSQGSSTIGSSSTTKSPTSKASSEGSSKRSPSGNSDTTSPVKDTTKGGSSSSDSGQADSRGATIEGGSSSSSSSGNGQEGAIVEGGLSSSSGSNNGQGDAGGATVEGSSSSSSGSDGGEANGVNALAPSGITEAPTPAPAPAPVEGQAPNAETPIPADNEQASESTKSDQETNLVEAPIVADIEQTSESTKSDNETTSEKAPVVADTDQGSESAGPNQETTNEEAPNAADTELASESTESNQETTNEGTPNNVDTEQASQSMESNQETTNEGTPNTADTEQASDSMESNQDTSSSSKLQKQENKSSIGPVSMKELERMLMENEEIEEDEVNDDMSGNVPDGDEPSPAMVQPPSPVPSPSFTISPSLSPSKVVGPSSPSPTPNPSTEEVSDWLPPAMAPGPDTELEPADKVPPTVSPPKSNNSGLKSKFEFRVIVSGLAIWAALAV